MTFGDVFCLAAVLLMIALSWRANRQLHGVDRLPMQWGFDGKPTWFAPRRIALAFSPVLATVVLLLLSLTNHAVLPQDKGAPGAIAQVICASVLAAVHIYHLRRAARG